MRRAAIYASCGASFLATAVLAGVVTPYAGPPVQLAVSTAVAALVALRLRRRHPAPPIVRNHHVHV